MPADGGGPSYYEFRPLPYYKEGNVFRVLELLPA
jgi:hypothetical protein